MSLEEISVLEKKIDDLIGIFQEIRSKNEQLVTDLKEKEHLVRHLEEEKKGLSMQIESLNGSSRENQHKLDTAAEKIQSIIAKLEAVA